MNLYDEMATKGQYPATIYRCFFNRFSDKVLTNWFYSTILKNKAYLRKSNIHQNITFSSQSIQMLHYKFSIIILQEIIFF
jgi:hypothetical protein